MTTLPWLGEVPAHWTVVRLRFVAKLNPSKTELEALDRQTLVSFLPMEAIGDDGSLVLDRTRPIVEVEAGFTYFRNGDITIAKITPCFENGKGALMHGLHNGIGFGTTELVVVRPIPSHLEARYLQYIFRSPEFRLLGEAEMYGAGGQKRVPDSFVRNFPIPLPPLAEQIAIAAYLDGETARIDGLVDDQRRLIELLRERRAAVIAHAVTKGLDPTAPLRHSGVAWLGEVPGHWGVVRNKVVFSEIDERSQEISEAAELLTVSHITGVTPRAEKEVNMFLAENFDGYKVCRSGDLVINTMWAWMGALGCARQLGIVSPSYNVYRLRESSSVNADYYDFLCRIPAHRTAMKAESTGVWESRLRLYPDAFLAMQMPLPPLAEQQAIAAYLDGETARIDGLIADAERGIALLQERRAAVISAAVRGDLTPGPSPFVGSPH